MGNRTELDNLITSAEVCAEKLAHVVEKFPETYDLHDTSGMDDIAVKLFACKRSSMRIDSEVMEDYALEIKDLIQKIREAAEL